MEGKSIDIIENLVQAVSILNKTDEYLESLFTKLSECDSLISDYEHFIENTPIEQVNLKKLYLDMQKNFEKRRIVKDDITLKDNFKNLTSRFNNITNREFLIHSMKTIKSKLGTKYHNRILTEQDIKELLIDTETKKGRGRPKKIKEEVIENV